MAERPQVDSAAKAGSIRVDRSLSKADLCADAARASPYCGSRSVPLDHCLGFRNGTSDICHAFATSPNSRSAQVTRHSGYLRFRWCLSTRLDSLHTRLMQTSAGFPGASQTVSSGL